MAENSAIEWTDTTWNPVTGCTKISAGCDNCYAARFSERFRGVLDHPFETGFDLTLRPERLTQPLSWKRPRMIYIDGFSGAGVHVVKRTREQIEGSPARALKITPPFDGFYFIDLNKDKSAHLQKLCEGRDNVQIINDDANSYLRTLLPTIQFRLFNRALCVLDPYGLHLDWDIIELAGKSEAVDMFLNFPVMDMNRNAIWRNPGKVPQDGIDRMNRFWGDESWKHAAYAKSRQTNLFSEPDDEKQSNSAIVAAFRERLNKVAGFEFVPEPMPMINRRNAVVYYLFFGQFSP